jgi:hypothetical protein
MLKEETIMNDQIKRAIRQRASGARTKDELVRAVFESFRAQEIDVRNVSLEDMKTALLVATLAAKTDPMAA